MCLKRCALSPVLLWKINVYVIVEIVNVCIVHHAVDINTIAMTLRLNLLK